MPSDDAENPTGGSEGSDEQAVERARQTAEAIDEIGAERIADLVVEAVRANETDETPFGAGATVEEGTEDGSIDDGSVDDESADDEPSGEE